MTAHVIEPPPPPIEFQPELPATLNQIILMAIAKDTSQVSRTATAFRNGLNSGRDNAGGVSPTADVAAAISAPAASNAASTASMSSFTSPAMSGSRTASAAAAPGSTQPMPMPNAPLPPPPSTGHRGLYMTLGALIVLVGLVVAGIYLPRRGKAAEDP